MAEGWLLVVLRRPRRPWLFSAWVLSGGRRAARPSGGGHADSLHCTARATGQSSRGSLVVGGDGAAAEEEEDEALYHVVMDDGDAEDLNEEELDDALDAANEGGEAPHRCYGGREYPRGGMGGVGDGDRVVHEGGRAGVCEWECKRWEGGETAGFI